MGLRLTGKGSILDAIGHGLNTAGNAVVSGVRDVGDLAGLGVANLTHNQQAAQNARNAMGHNNANLTGRSFGENAGGLSTDIGLTQAARAAAQVGVFGGQDVANFLYPGAGKQGFDDNSSLGSNFATAKGKYKNKNIWSLVKPVGATAFNLGTLGAGSAVAGATEALGANVAATAFPKATEAAITAARLGITKSAGPKLASRVVDAVSRPLAAGTLNTGLAEGQYVGSDQPITVKGAATTGAKAFGEGTLLGAGGEVIHNVPAVVKAAKPLDSSGKAIASEDGSVIPNIRKATNKIKTKLTESVLSPEDKIHESNPMAPKELTADSNYREPSAKELEASAHAADDFNHVPSIDFSKVDGATKQAEANRQGLAQSMRQFDSSVKGGQMQMTFDEKGNPEGYKRTTEHSPLYSRIFAERGRKPTKADYLAEADRHLARDPEHQDLLRHADAEQVLKDYQTADRQSGYNKVRTKNVPGMPKKGLPGIVKEALASPEYKAKTGHGELLANIRADLADAESELKAHNKAKPQMVKSGHVEGITALNERTAALRYKITQLKGMVGQQATEYSKRQQAFESAHPDVVLRRKGTRGKVSVSGETVKDGEKIVKVGGRNMSQLALEQAVMEGHISPAEALKGYVSPSARTYLEDEVAKEQPNPTPTEVVGRERPKSATVDNSTTVPKDTPEVAFDNLSTKEPSQAPARNLAGDTAAYHVIRSDGTFEQAISAYREATGASLAEAKTAVVRVVNTGLDVGTNKSVLSRNPLYKKIDKFKVDTAVHVSDRAKAFADTVDLYESRFKKQFNKLSEHDKAFMQQNIRGNELADVAAQAEHPEQFAKAAEAAKYLNDYRHELERIHGNDTIYRENYGAGLHYGNVVPEETTSSSRTARIDDGTGSSHSRHTDNYQEGEKLGLTPKYDSFAGDVAHDVRSTKYFIRDRSIFEGLQKTEGKEAVHWGQDFEHQTQLSGTNNVFATREVADTWNKKHALKSEPSKNIVVRAGKSAYRGASSIVTQATVLNPFIHGGNLLYDSYMAAGRAEGEAGVFGLAKNIGVKGEEAAKIDERMTQNGLIENTYNSKEPSFASRLTRGLTDINKQGIAAWDKQLTRATFKTLTDAGKTDREAVQIIQDFRGDKVAINDSAQQLGFFVHFAIGRLKNLERLATRPEENRGAIVNAIIGAGVVYGTDRALQAWLGNKHAYVHTPGTLGIAKDIVVAGENVAKGHYREAAGVVANRVNPLIKESSQQLFNKDLFSNKSVDATNGGPGRGTHAINALFPEAQLQSKVAGDKKSATEAASNFFGLYMSHAKGAPAAPSGRADFFNQKTVQENGQTIKVKPAKGNDPTGIDQRNSYFKTTEEAKKTLPAERQGLYDSIMSEKTDTEPKAQAHYAHLAAEDDIRAAIVKQKQAQGKATGQPIDPLYSDKITDKQRKAYFHIQAEPYKGDDYIQQTTENDTGKTKDWIRNLTMDRVKYFKTQDFAGAAKSERILPPDISAETDKNMQDAKALTGAEKQQFLVDHPDIQKAYDSIAKYTNDRRSAEGNAKLKLFPKASPEEQADLNEFSSLPKGDGKHGGNKTEGLWIRNNPDKFARIQHYLASEAEFEVANSAGQDRFEGSHPSQKELKAVYSLGKYDIAVTKNADGTKTYSIDPGAAHAQSSGGSGGGAYGNGANYSGHGHHPHRSYPKGENGFTFGQLRAARGQYSQTTRGHTVKLRTNAQNKQGLGRKLNDHYIRSKGVKVNAVGKRKTGKLRIKSATIH